jgi:hypothetical protein
MSSHSASVNSNNTNPSVDNRSVDSAQKDSDFQAISWDSSFVSRVRAKVMSLGQEDRSTFDTTPISLIWGS